MAKRTGKTETFSISVDPETRRILKTEAERNFGGNVSRLIAAIAREAQRKAARERVLADAPRMNDVERAEFEAEVRREISSRRKARAKKKSAA